MNFERGAPVLMAEWFKGVTWNVESALIANNTVKVLLSEPLSRIVSIVLGTATKSAGGPNTKYWCLCCGFVTYVSSYIANLYMPFEKKDGNLGAHTN